MTALFGSNVTDTKFSKNSTGRRRLQQRTPDTGSGRRVFALVAAICHDIEEAIYLADRVVVLTARPGRIREEVKIDLPRPRSLEVKKSLQCHEYRNHVWDLIRSESRRE